MSKQPTIQSSDSEKTRPSRGPMYFSTFGEGVKASVDQLPCLTPFLNTGKKFKLPSGETYDSLRRPESDLTSSAASTADKAQINLRQRQTEPDHRFQA